MTKLTNNRDLMNLLLRTIEKLDNDEIDLTRASLIGKSIETCWNGQRLELSYAHMRGETPNLPYMQHKPDIEAIPYKPKETEGDGENEC